MFKSILTRVVVLLAVTSFGVVAAQPEEKSEQQIEKDLFPTEPEIRTRGLAPVSMGAASVSAIATSSNVAGSVDLQAITFEFNSVVLTPAAKSQLDKLAAVLQSKDLHVHTFELIGHTDAVGTNEYNKILSERRARSAAAYLFQEHNIPAGGFKVYGLGEERLLNSSEPLAAENRRVEIVRLN